MVEPSKAPQHPSTPAPQHPSTPAVTSGQAPSSSEPLTAPLCALFQESDYFAPWPYNEIKDLPKVLHPYSCNILVTKNPDGECTFSHVIPEVRHEILVSSDPCTWDLQDPANRVVVYQSEAEPLSIEIRRFDSEICCKDWKAVQEKMGIADRSPVGVGLAPSYADGYITEHPMFFDALETLDLDCGWYSVSFRWGIYFVVTNYDIITACTNPNFAAAAEAWKPTAQLLEGLRAFAPAIFSTPQP